jgi:predicted ester cyclase
MGAAENRQAHTQWYEAENRNDLSHHEDYFHEDIEVHQPGVEPVVGIAAYKAMFQSAYASLPGFHTIVDDQIATDDRVVARWRTTATHTSESFGFPATGKPIEFSGISI